MLLCLIICAWVCEGCYSTSSGVPVWDIIEFLQWHSSVGQFSLGFSNGVPVYPASIRWVVQWYPSVHLVNQWYSSGIPVYTGTASVQWLKVRGCTLNMFLNYMKWEHVHYIPRNWYHMIWIELADFTQILRAYNGTWAFIGLSYCYSSDTDSVPKI